MEIIPRIIEEYLEKNCSEEPELLRQLNRETHVKMLRPHMLSGHVQGRFLSMLAKLCRPQNVLDIGTFTGYSALCLAEGLAENGKVITIDSNDEMAPIVNKYLAASERQSHIDFLIGDATQLLPTLAGPFDLVFIDADKENYSLYFDLVIGKVRKGGLIIADNVLWYGNAAIADQQEKPHPDTVAITSFNEKVQNDPRVTNLIVPLRDGLMLAMKN